MATVDLEETFSRDTLVGSELRTILPAFPEGSRIVKAMPEVEPAIAGMGKMAFLPWVDFTLENPDEIWDLGESPDRMVYHYFTCLGKASEPPIFVVEVSYSEDLVEINDFTLIVDQMDIAFLRTGRLLYSRSIEWQKEKQVRTLNELALTKYDEDHLDEARDLIDGAIRGDLHRIW